MFFALSSTRSKSVCLRTPIQRKREPLPGGPTPLQLLTSQEEIPVALRPHSELRSFLGRSGGPFLGHKRTWMAKPSKPPSPLPPQLADCSNPHPPKTTRPGSRAQPSVTEAVIVSGLFQGQGPCTGLTLAGAWAFGLPASITQASAAKTKAMGWPCVRSDRSRTLGRGRINSWDRPSPTLLRPLGGGVWSPPAGWPRRRSRSGGTGSKPIVQRPGGWRDAAKRER